MCETDKITQEDLQASKNLIKSDFEEIFKATPINKDTQCGYGFIRGEFLQKMANKKAYVFMFGVVGCLLSATNAYFKGTITTLEKRYKIPSRNIGIISVGNNFSSLFLSATLSYYAGKGHRPRWLAFGMYSAVLFCLLSALPHFLYGPGEEALSLTREFGLEIDSEASFELQQMDKMKSLCNVNSTDVHSKCDMEGGSWMPQIVLFISQLVEGVSKTLYHTLGISYMDDNIRKSKIPAIISLSFFFRFFGPAGGYALASYCLNKFISLSLTPTITTSDPRWLGAWWLGWLFLAAMLLVAAFLIMLFPKELPRAYVRRMIEKSKKKDEEVEEEKPASIKDMLITFQRLFKNKIYVLNRVASIFYVWGGAPYKLFTPKYIETQFKQSASTASFATGTVAMIFNAAGVILSGVIISTFKPRARYLALWNVFTGAMTVLGMITYANLGCAEAENSIILSNPTFDLMPTCNSNCNCDFVKYAPVCGLDGNTYISPCHAGCTDRIINASKKIFNHCSCIANATSIGTNENFLNSILLESTQTANSGPCKINCQTEFFLFIAVLCLLKFFSGTGRACNFLVTLRSVDEKDKPVSLGLAGTCMALLALAPSPIFFGALLDYACVVWGKTCTGKGNCWLYDGETLRYLMNYIAAGFVVIGTICDVGVWYYAKNLKIFDDKTDHELEMMDKK